MNGHQLISLLQRMSPEQLRQPVMVPHHEPYDSAAAYEEANLVRTQDHYLDDGKHVGVITITHGQHGSQE